MTITRSLVPIAGLATGLFAGWVVFPTVLYTTVDQPVQFNHAAHTGDGAGMSCQDCHALGQDGRFAGIPGIHQCAECHEEPIGSSENERRFVEEYVQQNREVPWLVYARQPDNAYFPHVVHVHKAKLACETCHGKHGSSSGLRPYEMNKISGYSRDIWGSSIAGIKSQAWDGMKMDDCISCHSVHNNDRACIDCHK